MEERGTWRWASGAALRPECENVGCWPWQPHEPSGDPGKLRVAVMAKNWPSDEEGLFNDMRSTLGRGFICEQIKDNCERNEENCDATWVKTIPVLKSTQPSTTRHALTGTTNPKLGRSSWKMLPAVVHKPTDHPASNGSNATTSSIRVTVTRIINPTRNHVIHGNDDPNSFTEKFSQDPDMQDVDQRVNNDYLQSITVVILAIVGVLTLSIAVLVIGCVLRVRKRKNRYTLRCWLHKYEPHGRSTVLVLNKDQHVRGKVIEDTADEQQTIDQSNDSSCLFNFPNLKAV